MWSSINTPVSENAVQDLYGSRGRRAPLHVRVGDRPAMIDERPTLTEGIEEYAFRAKEKLEAQDYAGAAAEGDRALDILPNLAEISMTRGLALLRPVVNRVMNGDGSEHVCRQDFKGAYDAFRLALVMDPHNAEAQRELERLTELLKRVPEMGPAGQNPETRPENVDPLALPEWLPILWQAHGAAGCHCPAGGAEQLDHGGRE